MVWGVKPFIGACQGGWEEFFGRTGERREQSGQRVDKGKKQEKNRLTVIILPGRPRNRWTIKRKKGEGKRLEEKKSVGRKKLL